MQLSNSEEQLMEHLWKLEKAFMKDLLEAYSNPKPATTTVATLLKRMIDKKFVAYNEFGNSREYYPLVKKSDYFSKHVNGLIKNFFQHFSRGTRTVQLMPRQGGAVVKGPVHQFGLPVVVGYDGDALAGEDFTGFHFLRIKGGWRKV